MKKVERRGRVRARRKDTFADVQCVALYLLFHVYLLLQQALSISLAALATHKHIAFDIFSLSLYAGILGGSQLTSDSAGQLNNKAVF